MEHSTKKVDLTGQRYGKLTVLRPAENIGAKTAWVCRCDCGQETTVMTCNLRTGGTKTCGCQHRKSKDNLFGLTFVDGTCVEVLAIKKPLRNNISGVRGVHWMADKQVWRAEICFKGKRRHLGVYRRLEDAAKARARAEEELYEPFLREFAGVEVQNANG